MNPILSAAHRRAQAAYAAVDDAWRAAAYKAFVEHARTHATFRNWDVREANKQLDTVEPRAWGGVAKRAEKAKIVEAVGIGFGKTRNNISVWRSLIFSTAP